MTVLETLSGSVRVIPLGPEDLPAISQSLDLVRTVYGDADRAYEDFFRWQNFQNPAGPSLLRAAVEKDRVVGRSALVPKRFWTGSQEQLILEWVDSITHPECRGKGVFSALAGELRQNVRDREFAFSYAMSYRKAHVLCIRKFGYSDLGVLPLLVHPAARLTRIVSTGGIREIDAVDERFDALWTRAKRVYGNLLVRDRITLDYRYRQIPRRQYKIAIVERRDALQAFCVYRIAPWRDRRLGLIVDLLALDSMSAKNLIAHALAALKAAKVSVALAFFSPNSAPYRAALLCGFLRCPQFLSPKPSRIIYRKEDSTSMVLTRMDRCYFTMGDFDFG